MLERHIAEDRPKGDLENVFKPVELVPGDRHFGTWSNPFTTNIASEKEFNNEASGRFRETFGSKLVLQKKGLPNGSIMDCVILEKPRGVPRVLVEFKKPTSSPSEGLDLKTHDHQPINYASQILYKYPEISILPIILTDGKSFVAGYGQRNSLGDLVIVLCNTQLTLYAGDEMGPDFGLFWAMCNHVSAKCPLEVTVQEEPQVVVRVKRCIGHGVSSLVYEASLVPNPAIKTSDDRVYAELERLGKFAIKITKDDHGDSWFAETKAFDRLKKKQIQNCCVFPIHSGSFERPFIIYPLGVPVFPTIDTKPGAASPLKVEHFGGLLEDLCAIHKAGLVHRDIRLANILMVGNVARLIDFGYATAPTTTPQLRGTQTTASQPILKAVLENLSISYGPKDDLESLLKAFLMHQDHVFIDYDTGKVGIWAIYESWKYIIKGYKLHTLTYDETVTFLEELFDSKDESWEDAWKKAYALKHAKRRK